MTIKYHDVEVKAFVTQKDYDQATYYTVDAAPCICGVVVYVNGSRVPAGDGQREKSCYFSGDGGNTARKLNQIQFGDCLYWITSNSGFNLSTSDKVGFRFSSTQDTPPIAPTPAVRGYNSVMKFLEQVMGDNDISTVSERLKAAELYLQYKGIPERDLKADNSEKRMRVLVDGLPKIAALINERKLDQACLLVHNLSEEV